MKNDYSFIVAVQCDERMKKALDNNKGKLLGSLKQAAVVIINKFKDVLKGQNQKTINIAG